MSILVLETGGKAQEPGAIDSVDVLRDWKVNSLLMLGGKNWSFIKTYKEEVANTILNYCSPRGSMLCGQPMYIQFSNLKEL
ncbi:hypothetical protein ACRRTK_018012 [Alexandromys fortis]